MGQREKFSTSDLAKVNKMYKCEIVETTTTPEAETTTEESTGVLPSTEYGTGSIESTTPPTAIPLERPPNNSNSYPVLEFLSGLANAWNLGK